MLDDNSPPSWIEILNKTYVQACIVILAPGISPETFSIDPNYGSEGRRRRTFSELQSCPLPNFAEIFQYIWFPKTPGSNTVVNSPLTTFLNVPLTVSQNQQRTKQRKRSKGMDI
jgi:hypothetical protein